ncbi:MAG: hypothetical protein SGPRY_003437 [Prymnesium sp.]
MRLLSLYDESHSCMAARHTHAHAEAHLSPAPHHYDLLRQQVGEGREGAHMSEKDMVAAAAFSPVCVGQDQPRIVHGRFLANVWEKETTYYEFL